jgi:hypothetical protein
MKKNPFRIFLCDQAFGTITIMVKYIFYFGTCNRRSICSITFRLGNGA